MGDKCPDEQRTTTYDDSKKQVQNSDIIIEMRNQAIVLIEQRKLVVIAPAFTSDSRAMNVPCATRCSRVYRYAPSIWSTSIRCATIRAWTNRIDANTNTVTRRTLRWPI